MTSTPLRNLPPPLSLLLLLGTALLLPACLYGPVGIDGDDSDSLFGPPGGEQDEPDDGNFDGEGGELDSPLRGFVHDPLGLRLPDVQVIVHGELAATTDGAGRFDLPDAVDGETVIMTFIKEGYATTWGSMVPSENGHNFFSQTMAPVDLETEFFSWQGTDFEIDGSHWFELPADSILDEDGEPYDGAVHLSATVWERATPLDEGGEYLASPGNGQGVDELGDSQLLYTYGMFQLEMVGEEGELLQAGPGVLVQVDVPENSNQEDGDQIPFWDFDDQTGEWVQQGQGQIVELEGGGQIWEFEPTQGLPVRQTTVEQIVVSQTSSCNPDQIMVTVTQEVTATATGQIVDGQGQPLQNAQVRVIAEDQTYMVPTQTDEDGWFSVNVPPVVQVPVGPNGRDLFIEVDYEAAEQPFLWRQDPIAAPPPSGVASFGVVYAGSMTCVQGTVVDPTGTPVSGIQIAGTHGGNDVSGSDGSFCLQVPKWQPSSVYALPPTDHAYGYRPARVRAAPTSAGGCGSCPNTVQLQAYSATSCADGSVWAANQPADGLRVEAFDARFPTAPVFSTVVEDGAYSLPIPAGVDVTLRVGAGDLHGANECASAPVASQSAGSSCVPILPLDCGE
jgi:hypothetical protein